MSTQMACPACRAALPPKAHYCLRCGKRVANVATIAGRIPAREHRIPAPGEPPPAPDPAADQTLWEGRVSAKGMIGEALLAMIFSAAVLALAIWLKTAVAWIVAASLIGLAWLYWGSLLLYRKWSVHYRLTSQRFYQEQGILRYRVNIIDVIDIDDLNFEQGLWDRMTGIGTIGNGLEKAVTFDLLITRNPSAVFFEGAHI